MLKSIDGVVKMLHNEDDTKPPEEHKYELLIYIVRQQEQYPQRDKINLARHYLADKLKQHYERK